MEATQQLPAIAGSEQVLAVPIDQISPDPSQPRKTFEEIREMANSIKAAGRILQPIGLRPLEGGYRIIFGERRYRGAQLLKLREIPATIFNVTEEQARVLQLIENLQRQDIHPMQQAKGFLSLIEECQMTTEEISQRLGKSIYFVRRQLKLNDLLPKWQKLYLKNAIPTKIALQLCILPPDAQKHLYDDQVNEDEEKSGRPITFNSYLFKNYKGDLTTASFDINDPNLDKKAGPCGSCPFNSALASLFPEEEQHARCNNILCFKNKTNLHLHNELTKAMEDSTLVLVYEGYSKSDAVEKLQSEGVEVLKVGYGDDCKLIRKPEKPEWEKFYQDRVKEKISERRIKEDFKKLEETFAFENEVFEKKVASGKYKKAFMVHSQSDKTGTYVYIELIPKVNGKIPKKKIDDGNATVEDIDNEITRLKDREKRAKELDKEKIHKKIVEALKSDESIKKLPSKPSSVDTLLLHFLLLEHFGWGLKEDVRKVIKTPGLWHPKDINQFKKSLQALSKPQVTYLLRNIILNKYSNCFADNTGAYAIRMIAESMGTIPIADIEKEQSERAQKRQQNVNKSIAVCQEIKKERLKLQKEKPTEQKTKPVKQVRA